MSCSYSSTTSVAYNSRCINGALNGNVGILKSMMVEITDSTNRNEAFSLSPLAWLTGATLGPIIGGTLSQPANQFPDIFGNTVFFKEYPYFLACAVPALFAAFSWLVVFFFLQDTVKNPAPITTFFWRRNKNVEHGSHTTTSASDEFPLPLRALLTTRRIVIAASNYAFLALCQIAFFTLLPVFLSTPPAFGGPGLPPATIGMLLTISGVLNAVLRLTYMSQILRVCGPRKTHLAGLIFTFFGFATFPVLSLAARREFDTLVRALALFQAIIPVGMSFSNVAISLFIATSSPNKASIGATNGISQVTVSIFRAIGPAAVNSLYSISLARGYMGGFMVYYVLMLITAFSFWLGTLLPKNC
ncbi:hypothetical protein AX14_004992 [Amanita brunnescens Koide BX004]|nr:hypothetical protein AX14_004992 [Amanita brunnescens Koide BX004]